MKKKTFNKIQKWNKHMHIFKPDNSITKSKNSDHQKSMPRAQKYVGAG